MSLRTRLEVAGTLLAARLAIQVLSGVCGAACGCVHPRRGCRTFQKCENFFRAITHLKYPHASSVLAHSVSTLVSNPPPVRSMASVATLRVAPTTRTVTQAPASASSMTWR